MWEVRAGIHPGAYGEACLLSTLLRLWPRNSRTARSVQQKPRGNTARWLMRALTQLAFFYSPGPPAQGMGQPRVGWSPLWQLTTKTVLHRQATGQSDLGNSSGDVVLWHDICVVTSWPFEFTRILLRNIHKNWTYTRLYMSKSWHILVLKSFRIKWWRPEGGVWAPRTGTTGSVRSLVWLLGNELRSSGRTVSAPPWNHLYSPQIKL